MGVAPRPSDQLVAVVFCDVGLILALSLLLGALARRFRQPAVIGEIVAGIALGPSLLGLLPGDLPARIFPADSRTQLTVLAQLGLALFMFGVGYEADPGRLRQEGRTVAVVSAGSIALPFVLGFGAGLALHPHFGVVAGRPVPTVALALFLGAAMSITAFPVLARILTERGLRRSRLGALALSCAAVNDLVAWCLLAVVVAIVSDGGSVSLVATLAGSAVFLAALAGLVAPGVRRLAGSGWAARQGRSVLVGLAVIGVLGCAAATARVGLHPVFGAFAFGVVVPRERVEQVVPGFGATVEQLSTVLLPVFFVVTGLTVDLWRLGSAGVLALLLVLPVAVAGKLFGAAGAARLAGLDRRQSWTVGLLMNARGLTELIILSIGRQLGILDAGLFTIMVIMALVTTVMTGPLLERVYPPRVQLPDEAPPGPDVAAVPEPR